MKKSHCAIAVGQKVLKNVSFLTKISSNVMRYTLLYYRMIRMDGRTAKRYSFFGGSSRSTRLVHFTLNAEVLPEIRAKQSAYNICLLYLLGYKHSKNGT